MKNKSVPILHLHLQHKAAKIVWLFIIFYIFIFCLVSYLKYDSFTYDDIDLPSIERIFWNTIHGVFVTDSLGEATIFSGGHLFLIIFLLSPLYALFPHALTLLFMQSIFLALPAYFIFRFAREKIDTTFAVYFALAYLLYPALAYINLFEFHPEAFIPFFLLPMFIFFDKRKFWLFVLFMLLSLSCKENVSIVIFGFGVYSLFRYIRLRPPFIRREDWKWIIVPLFSGILWFILATQFIQPRFSLAERMHLSEYQGVLAFYGWLGRTPAEIIKNIVTHPVKVLGKMFIPAKNKYILQLLGPLAFLSVVGLKEIVVVFFGLLESLLSLWPNHFSIYYHYPAPIMPFIFISAILGLRRLLRLNFLKRIRFYILIILFSVSLFSAFKIGPLFNLPFKQWIRDDKDVLKEKFIKLIPADANVIASHEIATRLTHGNRLFTTEAINTIDMSAQNVYLARKAGEESEYFLVDFFDYASYFGFYHQNSDIYLKDFLRRYNWNIVYEVDNIALFSKTGDNAKQLIATINSFPEKMHKLSFSNGYINLVGYNSKQEAFLGVPVLSWEAYLECQKQTDQRYVLRLDFYSKADGRLLYRHFFIAPDRIYPTKRWKEGEKIKIAQNVLLPESVQRKDCKLVINFSLTK